MMAYGAAYSVPVRGALEEGGVSILLADRNSGNTKPTERDANVRRAVACWNALEGIPTEDIEAYADRIRGLVNADLQR